jgi:two-component system cell cycle sensor histidine kinase/response regulator CckA
LTLEEILAREGLSAEARAAVLERESELRAILENAPLMMIVLDAELRVRSVNGAALRELGVLEASLLGRGAGEVFRCVESVHQPEGCGQGPTCQACPVRGSVLQALADGIPHQLSSASLPAKAGEERFLSLVATPLRLQNQPMVLLCVQDVSASVTGERTLRASEERYRRITEAIVDYTYTVQVRDGRAAGTQHGEACEAVTGYRSEEYAADPLLWYRMVLPEDRGRVEEQARRALAGEDVAPVEHRILRKDGELRWVRNTVVLHRAGDGRLLGYDGVVADVTERKQAEERLKASEQLFRALIEHSYDAVTMIDAEGTILFDSPSIRRVLGYLPSERVGRSVFDLVHPDEREAMRRGFTAFAGEKRAVALSESRFLHRDGGYRWIEGVRTNLLDDPAVRAVVVNYRDVTERRAAEEERRRLEAQVQHAQKLESLGVLAGGIAHDFNNLLVGVLGNASLAGLSLPEDSPARDRLREVEAAARRASELCRQLLAYSGRGAFVIEPVDLGRLAEEMIGFMRVSISKKVELRLELARTGLTVQADATQLRQVVLNLVVNASEAIGDRAGTITLTTGTLETSGTTSAGADLEPDLPAGRYAYLEVRDTGSGMSPEIRARLFDPFFTTKMTGRGLGLSAVLGIVRAHRGAVSVASSPGQGTTFRVLLPSVANAEAISFSPPPAGEPERWKGEGCVLLIDDEAAVLEVGRRVLESLGFTPLTAPDGRAGVETFDAHADEIRAVFLDLTMPQLGGPEVLGEIRRRRPDVPVVLMSGYSDHGLASPNDRERLAGFLAKPFDVTAFTDVLRRALERPPTSA